MTETETPRREASDPFGEWARSKDVLMSYRYLASAPHPIDRTHAENWLRLRRDTFDALHRFRGREALRTWDEAIDTLLERAAADEREPV